MALQIARCGLGAYLALASLAGCTDMPAAPQGPTVAATVDKALRNNGAKSWMASDAKSKDLLYVTNGPVDVCSYPQGELVGQLTGFSWAYGDCTDKIGNVYITDYKENTIVEYAHGGAQPIRTLSVPGTEPVACAVDPVSGDLAVTNAGQYGTAAGANVAIYRKAKGTPKSYTFRKISAYFYCTYDNAGDLYADGTPARGYGYYPAGGSDTQQIINSDVQIYSVALSRRRR